MRVIIKKPGEKPKTIEVLNLSEINKLVGNVDEDGNGWNHGGSDIRMLIGPGIDQYCKDDAISNVELGPNLWSYNDNAMYFGTVVFAGCDKNYDLCSLTDEQIQYCLRYISEKEINIF